VTAAAYALARMRMWRWLAITAAAASLLWMFPGMANTGWPPLSAHAFYIVAGFALAAVFIIAGLVFGPPNNPAHYDEVSCWILGGYLFGAFALSIASQHDPVAMTTLFVLAATTVAIAWRTDAAILAVPAAALFAALIVVHWAIDPGFVVLLAPHGVLAGVRVELQLTRIGPHIAMAIATATLFGISGFLAQARATRREFALLWSGLATTVPLLMLIAVYYRITQFDPSIPFAGLALVLAGLFAYATEQLWHREPGTGAGDSGAIFATGSVAALALTLTFALETGWLTIGLSLMVPGIAMIADRRPLPILRKLCGVIAGLVLARVGWNPQLFGDSVGTTPIFNWILYGYGLPALAFWIGGRILRRRDDDKYARAVESAAMMFAALTAFFEIRHLMNDGDIYRPGTTLGELGLQVATGLAMVAGLEHVRTRKDNVIQDWSARIFAALACATIVFGLLLRHNPMLTGEPVGGLFFNYILLGYGIPAALLAVLARIVRNTRPHPYYLATAISAIAMMLIYLSFEIRTIFHGPVLVLGRMTDAEDYTYSAVWLAFGVALLLGGIALKSQPARLASAAVVTLTILKVFLHDLAGVQGIYRALSFIGLGLVLMGIGWLYQRLLFPPRRENATSENP
jgi:uncharacterized membrane protein